MEKKNNMEVSSIVKSHFLRLYHLAMVDNNFSPTEWDMLYEFGEKRGVSSEKLNEILLDPVGELEIPESFEEKIEYLIDFSIMIWADGVVANEERDALIKFCTSFEIESSKVNSLSDLLLENVEKEAASEEIIRKSIELLNS